MWAPVYPGTQPHLLIRLQRPAAEYGLMSRGMLCIGAADLAAVCSVAVGCSSACPEPVQQLIQRCKVD